MVIDALEVKFIQSAAYNHKCTHNFYSQASEHGKAEKAVRINAVGSGIYQKSSA